jgi:hypothetical protein
MFERVFTPLGITGDDLRWRNNQYRKHDIEGIPRREFGAGIHANVEALSRLGYLYLHDGRWNNKQIISKDFVRIASRPVESVVGLPEWTPEAHGNASDHYGLLWWNNANQSLAQVPPDAFWAWGLYEQGRQDSPPGVLWGRLFFGAQGNPDHPVAQDRESVRLKPGRATIVALVTSPTGRGEGNAVRGQVLEIVLVPANNAMTTRSA